MILKRASVGIIFHAATMDTAAITMLENFIKETTEKVNVVVETIAVIRGQLDKVQSEAVTKVVNLKSTVK